MSIRVGDVRRALPVDVRVRFLEKQAVFVYRSGPFQVLAVGSKFCQVVNLRGRKRKRDVPRSRVETCPRWPAEHRPYEGAEGY